MHHRIDSWQQNSIFKFARALIYVVTLCCCNCVIIRPLSDEATTSSTVLPVVSAWIVTTILPITQQQRPNFHLYRNNRYYKNPYDQMDHNYRVPTKLQLQFQAGNIEDNDNDNDSVIMQVSSTTNTTISTTTATTTTSSSSIYNGVYATISSEQAATATTTEIIDMKTNSDARFLQTIRELQQIYGNESISIVPDDELDENENDDDITYIHINALIFVIERNDNNNDDIFVINNNGDGNYQQTDEYVLVIVGSDRRVNTTTLENVIDNEIQQRDEKNNGMRSTSIVKRRPIQVQLAPRDRVESLCNFPPGTVPPILGFIGTTGLKGLYSSNSTNVPNAPMVVPRPPILTIIDESLVSLSRTVSSTDEIYYYIGGGGQPNYSCRITIDVLLQQPETVVGKISNRAYQPRKSIVNVQLEDDNENNRQVRVPVDNNLPTTSTVFAAESHLPRSRPYFTIAGPSDTYEAKVLLSQLDDVVAPSQRSTKNEPILQDGWDAVWEYQQVPKFDTNEIVTFVGRIGKVRRMARELSFCDLVPPDIEVSNAATADNDDDDIVGIDIVYPWRNPVTDTNMAVQLICGKTLCQNFGGSDHAIRQIHAGQLLLIHGRTNLQSKNSLRNWIYNQTLDIVVLSYVLLLPVPMIEKPSAATSDRRRVTTSSRKTWTKESSYISSENCLRFNDLYDIHSSSVDKIHVESIVKSDCNNDSVVNGEIKVNGDNNSTTLSSQILVVDDFQSVSRFSKDVSQLLQSYNLPKINSVDNLSSTCTTVGLVGIDCEWKPTFFLESSRDPQPVLVLQISLHPLKRVYLFDFQTLLRPMMPQSQPMDKLEMEVSFVLQALFESKRLVKVGFHIVNDLRQMAASYPHVPALQFYNAVVEASTLGKKAIRRTQSGNAREATSSLSRLVDHFIGKPLNKQEQCSDWSKRPFTAEQIEYAALDAAVTPIMVEKMIHDLDVSFFGDKPYLGRWESDMSFKTAMSSLRFVFIQTIDPNVQRKLKAKQVVGDPMIVSQSWITGDVPPKLPMLPESDSDGAYTDIHGVVQIPSVSVNIRSNHIGDVIDSMIGNKIGTSKDMCVANFLHRPMSFPDGARLEYPQRSGFVEFKDGVVLFVNMQSAAGNRYKSKSYPNEWLLDGKILTWFLRENDWQRGETPLAKKLMADPNSVFVTLFVRMGRSGEFICCGRCRVQDTDEINGDHSSVPDNPDSWTLIKLNLMLLDWKKLRSSSYFQSLLNLSNDTNPNTDDSVFD